jgi:hypothetical protein
MSSGGRPPLAVSTSVANQTPRKRATHIRLPRQGEYLHQAEPGCHTPEHDDELSSAVDTTGRYSVYTVRTRRGDF